MKMRNVAEREIVGKCALSARGDRGVILLVVLGMLQLLALTALLENPDDVHLQESALVSVDQALRESSAITDGSEAPTPETRSLDGLLHAAYALFDQLVALLREPRPIACP